MITLRYVQRRATSVRKGYDNLWHIVRDAGEQPKILSFDPGGTNEYIEAYTKWVKVLRNPQTFCGQKYIQKHWRWSSEGPTNQATTCDTCWAEAAVWRIEGN